LTPYYSDYHYTATLRYTSPHFTQLHFTTLIDVSLPLIKVGDNIKIDIKEIGSEGVEWIDLP
jgi:hypothetical protein